jgi:hypothetical protein
VAYGIRHAVSLRRPGSRRAVPGRVVERAELAESASQARGSR